MDERSYFANHTRQLDKAQWQNRKPVNKIIAVKLAKTALPDYSGILFDGPRDTIRWTEVAKTDVVTKQLLGS